MLLTGESRSTVRHTIASATLSATRTDPVSNPTLPALRGFD